MQLSRRTMLAGSGAVTLSYSFGDTFMNMAYGATSADHTLVVMSLRGGFDGLSAVVPHADPNYLRYRPTLGVPKASLLAMNSTFGLNPKLAALLPMWNAGKIAVIPAAGLPVPNFSHFTAIAEMEAAGIGVKTGWINRMVGSAAIVDSTFAKADALIDINPTLTYSCAGPAAALVGLTPYQWAVNPADFKLTPDPTYSPGLKHQTYQAIYAGSDPLKQQLLYSDMAAGEYIKTPAPSYSESTNTQSGFLLSQAARFINTPGFVPKVISVEEGVWDHHSNQAGQFPNHLQNFATEVSEFFANLGPRADNVTLITLSEFGRTVKENGSGGTDHGWATACFVMGAGVKGGYYGRWPGLYDDPTQNSKVDMAIDYRQVVSDVLYKLFPQVDLSATFPGFVQGSRMGFML